MRRDGKHLPHCKRPLFRAGAVTALALISTSMIAGCTRSGPPAPLVDKTGIYYTRPASPTPPITPAPRTSVASAPLSTATPSRRPSRPAAVETRSAIKSDEKAGTLTSRPGANVTVAKGETLYAVSRRHRVPIRALIDANKLTPPYELRAGQRLRVPSVRVYVVAPGDTVTALSRRFDTGVSEVIRLNDLKAPDYGLFTGQRLALPRANPAPVAAREEVRRSSVQSAAVIPPRVEVRDPNANPPPRAAGKFGWPLQGRLLSGFGAKGGGLYNDGINIAADPGTLVRASENGIVAYVGNELRGYGNLILVRHSGGWISAYAHAGEFLVRRGQVVKRGQPIAKVGASGAVNRPQLHFELRQGNRAVDPKRHLS